MFDLKGHIRSNKVLYVYLFISNNSSVKPTIPLMLPQIACALLSPLILFCSLDVETRHKFFIKSSIMRSHLSYGELRDLDRNVKTFDQIIT